MNACCFVPPFLLERIASAHPDDEIAQALRRTLELDAELRARRAGEVAPPPTAGPDGSAQETWTVYTARNGSSLPGTKVRAKGDPDSGDAAVDEAYAGVEASLAFFREVLGRSSYDAKGAPVTATVHYQRGYDNAFWDGRQLVFGDGDGQVFQRFTKPVDVLGHELSHAVTQYTAGLTYRGQSGALNESLSDVFGSCVKQRLLGQSAAEADWLIGEGLFTAQVQGSALRSMAAPGTAYDDRVLGKDPQVGDMKDYVQTTDDNGGVHTNSGIPNRAFYLAATALGGNAWEQAGPIWYAALTSGIGADTDFAGFARATVTAAAAVSDAARTAVEQAWQTVGVLAPGGGAGGASAGPVVAGAGTVAVRRSGGLAGQVLTGQATLGDDPRSTRILQLLAEVDLRGLATSEPQPDRFVYAFSVDGEEVTVGEQDLTPELEELAALLIDR